MRTPPTTNLLLLALLALVLTGVTACGGKAARERSQALLESQTGEKWFCQIAEDQTSWDCVQSNELAAAPAPERMPVPREELLALEVVEVEVDGMDAIETVAVETLVVEPAIVEAEAVETVVAETEVIVVEVDETNVVETETDELEVDGTDVVETRTDELAVDETDAVEAETTELDAIGTAPDSTDRPRAELYALPDDAYLVELVAMPSAQALDSLIKDRELTDVIAVRIAADGVFHHVLLTGPYADEPTAQEFATLPPDHLQDFRLRVISVRFLKVAMREADQLANGADDQGYVAALAVAETDSVELDPAGAERYSGELPNVGLASLPDDSYVVQLLAMRSAQTLDHLIEARGLTEVIPARVAVDGEIYHILLIGPFDEPGAQEFAAAPPDHLQDFQPWVRSVSSLKAAMREADELSPDGLEDER